jgi:hypothetical protein
MIRLTEQSNFMIGAVGCQRNGSNTGCQRVPPARVGSSRYYYFIHWPIFSVPKVPMPFSRKAKTIRFSFRSPTLKV